MKKSVALLATLFLSSAAFAQKVESGSYQLDAMHSKVGFEIPHLVISSVEGRFTKFSGTVELNEKFESSKVDASIEVESIDTGVKDRDDHLKSADFFDAKKFPKLTFKSTAISGKPESFKLSGDLTIHGVTKKITLDGKYLGTVKDAYGQQKVAFDAKAKINRKDFGLTWGKAVEAGPIVGDEVTLSLKLQAGKPGAK
jgi:polyisoprenoid-binding protein YceI